MADTKYIIYRDDVGTHAVTFPGYLTHSVVARHFEHMVEELGMSFETISAGDVNIKSVDTSGKSVSLGVDGNMFDAMFFR